VSFDLQPRLENSLVRLEPLEPGDFEHLYEVASDPLIWEQHPSRDRYRREVFVNYFQGAIESKGAFKVIDAGTGELFGCSRFYDYQAAASQVSIGYTFIARSHWARGYNRALKQLMLDHAFLSVERVIFQVGSTNFRSRAAMEKLGAQYVGEESVAYFGEAANPNVIYHIDRLAWMGRQA
jgi:RimJ/RimL family protein N-acetyltransferase